MPSNISKLIPRQVQHHLSSASRSGRISKPESGTFARRAFSRENCRHAKIHLCSRRINLRNTIYTKDSLREPSGALSERGKKMVEALGELDGVGSIRKAREQRKVEVFSPDGQERRPGSSPLRWVLATEDGMSQDGKTSSPTAGQLDDKKEVMDKRSREAAQRAWASCGRSI